jgi:hypothetical protein
MPTTSHSCHSEVGTVELSTGLHESGLSLERYVLEANQKLDEITDCVRQGEVVERETRDWMLTQVDFVVETIGDENLQLSEDLRSQLLQLLLAIANLNEHIRREASASLPTQ